jgi:DNA-binding transcriptional LysR family regulator
VADALVAFDCRVTASERVGSHFVVFGSVQDIFVAGAGAPLIYANRAYGVPQHFHARHPSPTPGTVASLSLGCFQTFAPYLVPALIARLSKLNPGLSLNLLEADQSHLLAALRRGEIEIALLYDFGMAPDIRVERLAELVPYVLLAEGHPLAESAAVSLPSLVDEPLILLDIEPSRDYFLSLFKDRGLQPLVGHRTSSLEMVRGLVAHGLGYSILATKPANAMSYDGRALVARPLASMVNNSHVSVAGMAGRDFTPIAQEFSAHCRSFFGLSHAYSHS